VKQENILITNDNTIKLCDFIIVHDL
ncbi:unnamed protein product, partial [Rotaria sp. Silwood2]